MPLASCPRCERMFDKQDGKTVCETCERDEMDDIERVAEYVSQHPDVSPAMVAAALDMDTSIVMRAVEAGRIAQVREDVKVPCGRCGAPAISFSKKLCEACLAQLDAELARERAHLNQKHAPKPKPGVRETIQDKRIT